MARKYELTETEALMAFNLVSSHTQSIKNWMASAIENKDFDRASSLVAELRTYQKLYAKLNVEVHKFIDNV